MAAGVGLALITAGCAGDTSARHQLAHYRGMTFDEVLIDVDEDATIRVVDTSVSFGGEASYTEYDLGSSQWAVLNLCADASVLSDASTVEFLVAPVEYASPEVVEKAKTGYFDSYQSCLGLTYRP